MRARREKTFLLLLLGGIAFLSLGLAEAGARAFFSAYGHPYRARQLFTEQRVLDPFLGWSKDPPFTEYRAGEGKPFLLVALGGSTTDALYMPEKNWVKHLAGLCGATGRACTALNGGVSGYNSTQELLKLQRDVVPMQPALVVVLNGVNDGVEQSQQGNSFIYTQARERMEALAGATSELLSPSHADTAQGSWLPGLRRLGSALYASARGDAPPFRVHFGHPDGYTRAQRWERNVRMMQASAAEFGMRLLVVLQPHSATSAASYRKARHAVGIVDSNPEETEAERRSSEAYFTDTRAACRRLPYCLDLSHSFDDPSLHGHWTDPAHLDQDGHRREAELIFSELRRRRWL